MTQNIICGKLAKNMLMKKIVICLSFGALAAIVYIAYHLGVFDSQEHGLPVYSTSIFFLRLASIPLGVLEVILLYEVLQKMFFRIESKDSVLDSFLLFYEMVGGAIAFIGCLGVAIGSSHRHDFVFAVASMLLGTILSGGVLALNLLASLFYDTWLI